MLSKYETLEDYKQMMKNNSKKYYNKHKEDISDKRREYYIYKKVYKELIALVELYN